MPAESLKIRPYLPSDHAPLMALWNTLFPDDPPWNEPGKLIQTKLTVQPELLFVACIDSKIVGAIMAGFDGVRGWVHHLAVDPASRRQGIATQLMRAAESGLQALGCPKVNLQVRSTNLEVIRFYQSLGYAVEERASLGKRLA